MFVALENMSYEVLLEVAKKQESRIGQMESQINEMQFHIDQLKRLFFGAKRERFVKDTDENQLTLPFEVEEDKSPEKQQEVITYIRSKTKRENHPGRLSLPAHLHVKEIILEPEEDTTGLKCIGREVTDQLELTPPNYTSSDIYAPNILSLLTKPIYSIQK